jgi:DNA processing protein
MQITKTSIQNSNYPDQLREIQIPPSALFALGEIGEGPFVAIVGSRKPTSYGRHITYDFAYELAKARVTVVSGLARGIDSEAHRGAIDAGGKTIAVMACGLDLVYPQSNRNLAIKILESGGALVSEYPVGTPPL